jgi:hypothetical protein
MGLRTDMTGYFFHSHSLLKRNRRNLNTKQREGCMRKAPQLTYPASTSASCPEHPMTHSEHCDPLNKIRLAQMRARVSAQTMASTIISVLERYPFTNHLYQLEPQQPLRPIMPFLLLAGWLLFTSSVASRWRTRVLFRLEVFYAI